MKRIYIYLMFLPFVATCQSDGNKIEYSFPFDDKSIHYHQDKINLGVEYLLMVPEKDSKNTKFFIVNSSWYQPLNDLPKLNYKQVDSLLNEGINGEELNKFNLPIELTQLKKFEGITTCEIVKQAFPEGFLRDGGYLYSEQLLIAELLRRGKLISAGGSTGFVRMPYYDQECK